MPRSTSCERWTPVRNALRIPSCELSVPRGGDFDRAELGDLIAGFLSTSPSTQAGVRAPQLGGFQTIAFTDIESSTAFTQRVGDSAAHELLRVHDRAARDAIEQHAGYEVKHTGDGIMASFDSAVSAVEASLARLLRHSGATRSTNLRTRRTPPSAALTSGGRSLLRQEPRHQPPLRDDAQGIR
jgi:hypothetical protein